MLKQLVRADVAMTSNSKSQSKQHEALRMFQGFSIARSNSKKTMPRALAKPQQKHSEMQPKSVEAQSFWCCYVET